MRESVWNPLALAMGSINNLQLYIALGLPTIAVLTSLGINLFAISGIRSEIDGIRREVDSIRREIDNIRADIREIRGDIKLLTGKVYEMMGSK